MAIKLVVLDVDGTLTDGSISYCSSNIEMKTFNVKDGAILNSLTQLGIEVIFLTGRKSEATTKRAQELNIKAIQGVTDKETVLKEYMLEHGISGENIAYIGDDINDHNAMLLCDFKACPVDAALEIKSICDYVSDHRGGYGAVRDICESLLHRMGKYEDFLNLFGISRNTSTLDKN